MKPRMEEVLEMVERRLSVSIKGGVGRCCPVALENVISRIISNDVKWFNDIMNQKFRSVIQVGSICITDKDEYRAQKSQRDLEFEDLVKKQNYARIGTVALKFGFGPSAFGLLATMGVGTAWYINHFLIIQREDRRTTNPGKRSDCQGCSCDSHASNS